MKNLLSISLFLFFSFSLLAQLPDGSIAPDFTVEDINGDVHNLYDYLDDGKSVILDFGATWCGPCWSYHNTGILESLYSDFGPGGSDEIMVFMVEADGDTTQDCIYGLPSCIGGTTGDWTAGVDYPILNPPANEADALANDYSIAFWPTLYGVAPNGEIYVIGQASYDEWASITVNSFQMVNSTYELDDNGCVGNIDVTTVGGEGDLEYEWSNGETTEDLFDLSEGEYTLTITDENNFEVIIGPIDVEGGEGNEIAYSEQEDLSCNENFSGYLFVEAEGGSGDYAFDWSNGASGDELFDLPSGDYWLTVTDNDNGCTSETYFFVDEPEALTVNVDVIDAGCASEGEVFIDTDGGTGSYTYNFPDFSTTFNEIDLPAGNYEVTISDFNDCEIITAFEILATPPPAAVSSASGMITCTDPSVTLSSAGSATGSDVSYTWYDSSNNIIGNDPSISVSNEGDYVLEVFDAETGCTGIDQVTVEASVLLPTAITNYSNEISCINNTATVSGMGSSTAGVTYTWTTADGSILSGVSELNATVGAGGTYWLQVSDPTTGCSATSSIVVPGNNALPLALIDASTEICEGSVAQICVSSDGPITVEWSIDGVTINEIGMCIDVSTSSDLTATVTNTLTGCSNTANTQVVVAPIPQGIVTGESNFCEGSSTMLCVDVTAGEGITWVSETGVVLGTSDCVSVTQSGNYSANVVNASGCESSTLMTVTTSEAPSAAIAGQDVICFGDMGTLCADESGQNYQWLLNGVVIASEQCINVALGGDYQLVIDNGNCSDSEMFTVTADDSTIPVLSASGILDCNNQSVTITAITNTDVTWVNEAGVEVGTGLDYTTNLAGVYTAIGTSLSGLCEAQSVIEVTQDDTALPTAAYAFNTDELTYEFQSSSQGMISSYLWDFGDGSTSTDENPTHTYDAAGDYTVCLTVTNDCGSNSDCQNLSSSIPLAISIETLDVSCPGGNDGDFTIEILGGSPPYTYTVSPDILLGEGLFAGDYEIIATDSDGESISTTITINEPTVITAVVSLSNATQGNDDGEIILDVSGGTPGYTYLWDNGSTDAQLSNLPIGFYSVQVTDANGCVITETYEIQEVTAVNDIDFIKKFTASPNPAINQLNIELDMEQGKDVAIELINNLGVVVYRSNIDATSTSHNVDVSIYPNGVYFIHLRHQSQSMTKKIMIIE